MGNITFYLDGKSANHNSFLDMFNCYDKVCLEDHKLKVVKQCRAYVYDSSVIAQVMLDGHIFDEVYDLNPEYAFIDVDNNTIARVLMKLDTEHKITEWCGQHNIHVFDGSDYEYKDPSVYITVGSGTYEFDFDGKYILKEGYGCFPFSEVMQVKYFLADMTGISVFQLISNKTKDVLLQISCVNQRESVYQLLRRFKMAGICVVTARYEVKVPELV